LQFQITCICDPQGRIKEGVAVGPFPSSFQNFRDQKIPENNFKNEEREKKGNKGRVRGIEGGV